MKRLSIVLIILLAMFMTGCFVTPTEPIIEPVESPIVCEGGFYAGYGSEWSFTGCEEDPYYPAGIYWFNANGRIFLIGDMIASEDVFSAYGACPTEYVEEIFR